MHCREFRAQHCAFVDDTLSVAGMAAMRDHLEVCAQCSAHDTRVRRSLLVVRNAPEVRCSPDFGRRLEARIRELGPVDRRSVATRSAVAAALRYGAFAASLVVVGTVAALVSSEVSRATPEVRMAPVVASLPEPEPVPVAVTNPAYVASVMSGMPVWPALLVAGQSSIHMANYEYQLTSSGGQALR